MTEVKTYAYTTGVITDTSPTAITTDTFGYDLSVNNGVPNNRDKLISFNSQAINYNAMGCPTTCNGYTASWTRGKLSKLTKGSRLTGTHTYNYTYNAFGQRIRINYTYMAGTSSSFAVVMGMLTGYSHTFRYDQSGRLICESKTSDYYGEGSSNEQIVYLYDETGIIGMVHTTESGTTTAYYFQRNLLGDVIGIYTTGGTKVGGYTYDAWGNCTITLNTNGIATRNPIRYRGYYYDEDTKLYYLNARYYCPEWRRFISPDDTAYLDPESVNGLNLYAYCGNDPVNRVDPSGHSSTAWWEWALAGIVVTGLIVGAVFTGGTLVGAALAGAAIGAGMSLGIQALSGDLSWSQFVLDTGVGALTGLIGGSGLSRCSATILGGAIGAGSNLATQLINGEDISIMQILIAGAIGAASGFIGGAGARNKAAINQGKGVQSATKQLNKVIRRIANGYRYNATTAQVAFTNAMNGLTNAISSQMGRMFATAMVSYGISTVAFAGVDAGFDYLGWWFF